MTAFLLLAAAAFAQPADLVLRNGKIVTMDERRPAAQALAAGDGRILAAGSDSEVGPLIGPKTRVIDLKAKPEPAKLEFCPRCGASLAWVTSRDLRLVQARGVFRCRPGQEPRIYELRCRACNRLLVVVKTSDGGMHNSCGRDMLDALREIAREGAFGDQHGHHLGHPVAQDAYNF